MNNIIQYLFKRRFIFLANSLTIICFLLLPYFLFNGKLFIGGDDTRILYVYPWEYLKNLNFFSWTSLSSFNAYLPKQAWVPFLLVWTIVSKIIVSKVMLDYLAFSLPFILGFIYFQKLLGQLIQESQEHGIEIYLGSLFYILSPILIVNQWAVFLTSVWLIPLFCIIAYYSTCFIKRNSLVPLAWCILWCTIFSVALFAVPWMAAFSLLCLIGAIVSMIFLSKRDMFLLIKKTFFFWGAIGFSQAFWIVPFLGSIIGVQKNSLGAITSGLEAYKLFESVVLATASGNIFYPLLNLSHRQIAFDFGWSLKAAYLLFYDKTLILNNIYPVILFGGFIFFKKYLNVIEKKIFVISAILFIFSLYFFTVNIGPLEQLYLLLGRIPSFAILKHFYDKFAPTYVFFFSLVITFALVILKRKYKIFSRFIFVLFFLITLITIIPIKMIINHPFNNLTDTYLMISPPTEYVSFMKKVENIVPQTTTILSIPLSTASYSIIKDTNSNNIYIGTSPVTIFTGITELSGDLSFSQNDVDKINNWLTDNNYSAFSHFLYSHNVDYFIYTKNIPRNIFAASPFKRQFSVDMFLYATKAQKVFSSTNGSYILYEARKQSSLITPSNISFSEVNPTQYQFYIHHLPTSQPLLFLQPFHNQWMLYPEIITDVNTCLSIINGKCRKNEKLFVGNELSFLWRKPIVTNTHMIAENFANEWVLNRNALIKNVNPNYYKKNSDGTVDMAFTLYFRPQSYFFVGILMSIIVDSIVLLLILLRKQR